LTGLVWGLGLGLLPFDAAIFAFFSLNAASLSSFDAFKNFCYESVFLKNQISVFFEGHDIKHSPDFQSI
jgi:hypothetical protein